MKYIYRVLLLLILNLYSLQVQAGVDETGTIDRIIVESNSLVSVWLSGPDVVTECVGGYRWTVSNTDGLFKEKLSLLLTAASQNKIIHLHHTTGWGCGNWDSNKIYYIDVKY